MNIDTETMALLDAVFGEQLPADLVADAQKLGFRSALCVVMKGREVPGLQSASVSALIRIALCKGLGEMPYGWSLLPKDDDEYELTFWVLAGLKDEVVKQLDEALSASQAA